MQSIDSREGIPQAMSTKAPKCSRCVTRASMMSPGISSLINERIHSSCALLRESRAYGLPFSSSHMARTLKQTALPTREIMAMSLTISPSWTSAASFLRITPRIQPRSTVRSRAESQLVAIASSITPSAIARSSPRCDDRYSKFVMLPSKLPSGRYFFCEISVILFSSFRIFPFVTSPCSLHLYSCRAANMLCRSLLPRKK